MQRAFRLGITGNIGSGKSTFCRIASENGITIIDSDSLAKTLMHSEALRPQIEAIVGSKAYNSSGELVASYVAAKIFRETAMRQAIEAVVHPAVSESLEGAFRDAEPGSIVGVESALIFQTALYDMLDHIILIEADESVVRERLSDRFAADDVQRRLENQGWQASWREDADLVLENSGTKEEFESRCLTAITILKIFARRPLPNEPLNSIPIERQNS